MTHLNIVGRDPADYVAESLQEISAFRIDGNILREGLSCNHIIIIM